MERDANLVSPVNFMPNGGLEQKLSGDSTTTSSSSSPLRSDEKVKSRYLGPHMASCHDFCKYGKKHDSDAEERRLNLRKFLKKTKKEKLARGEEQNQVTIVVSAERRIRTVTKPKATAKVGTEFPDNAGGPNPRTPPTMKNSIISGEKKTLKTSLDNEQGQAKCQDPRDERKVTMIKGGTVLLDNTVGSKPQTPPSMKNSIASGEKDTLNISLDNEHSQTRSQDPRDGKKVEVIKGGTKLHLMDTELPDNTEGAKPQTPPTMGNSIASDEKKLLQTSLENKQGQAKSLNPRDGKKVQMIKGRTLPSLQSRPRNQPDGAKLEDFLPAACMDASKQSNINNKEKTKSSLMKQPISPFAPKVIKQKVPPSATERLKIKQKVPLPAKRVDGAGKSAVTLKTKAPLVRSLSQRKSSRSLIARRNQENEITRSLGTSKIGARELLKPSTISFSSKSSQNMTARRNQDNKVAKSLTASKIGERKILKLTRLSFSSKKPDDNALSLQLRKLRSIKRTSAPHGTGMSLPSRKLRSTKLNSVPHDSVPSMQPRKLRSIKRSSTPHDSVPIMQLRKLRSIKQTLKPHDSVLSLQLRKLRSVKQTSTPHESSSSLQPRKLWNVKLTSALRDSVSILQPRKLRSMKRNSSMKDKDKVGKANNAVSKSGINDLDPNVEIEESESATRRMSDQEIEGNDNVEVSKDDEKKRTRRTVTAPAQPEDNSSTPFKLKFKRGKVINFRSDSIGARRLWFNLGMLASDNLNGNGLLGRRSFRRRRNNASIDSKDPDSEVQYVVLKHQGVTEKKDGQALFNHVIEETASKLVETRKSKVKALVGAFETVISLQESKPASAV